MKAHEIITPTNHPKIALNHILIDEANIVSTDTIMLLTTPHNEDVSEKMLVINSKAKVVITAEGLYNNKPINNTLAKQSYPNYQQLIAQKKNYSYTEHKGNLIDTLYHITATTSWMCDYIKLSTKLNKLNKALPKVTSYLFREKTLPIQIKFEDGSLFILMPYINIV